MKTYVFTTTTGRQFQITGHTLRDCKQKATYELGPDEGIKNIEKAR